MPNYHRWLDWLQGIDSKYRSSSVYLLLLVLVAFLLGAWISFCILSSDESVVKHIGSNKSQRLTAELEEQTQLLATRNLELSIEREANAQMQEMFGQQIKKQKDLEYELAFYRSIMSPDDNAEGIAIHGLEMTPGALADEYNLKLILTQLQKRKQAIQGRAELTLIGVQEGKSVELSVNKLTGSKLEFDFRYFQVIDTKVTVPAGFNLLQVKVKVVVPSSRWTKNSQTERVYSVPELLQGEKEPRVILEQNSQVTDNLPQKTNVRGSND
ncbi:hypothetical protein MYF52_05350 [Shewanella putrefaciens]|uniref:DUF6776 family protein n=1 Tax=Shewanella putrefaciens TaxID=24 RepID=UPI0021BFA6AF|nr:DUF6776 family protein [Shewanella putrefaciens]MCT8942560.1 hypothetical protein [Shewanella putrefaciens]